MNIDVLDSFLAMSNKKSMAKAASYLHISQPTLSYRIKKLEEDLGFTLIERSWEGVKLTNEGHYFLPYAVQIAQELRNACNVLRYNSNNDRNSTTLEAVIKNKNTFRIGINLWLSPVFTESIITELSYYYPNLEYKFITRPTNTLKDLLEYEGIDLGIYYQNEVKTSSYCLPLFKEELVLICCEDDFSIIKKNINNLQALDKPFLFYDNPILSNNSNLLDKILTTLNIENFKAIDNMVVMASFIATGKGYTIIPKSGLSQIANLSSAPLKDIPLDNFFPMLEIHMAYNKETLFEDPINSIANKLSPR